MADEIEMALELGVTLEEGLTMAGVDLEEFNSD